MHESKAELFNNLLVKIHRKIPNSYSAAFFLFTPVSATPIGAQTLNAFFSKSDFRDYPNQRARFLSEYSTYKKIKYTVGKFIISGTLYTYLKLKKKFIHFFPIIRKIIFFIFLLLSAILSNKFFCS